MSISLMPNPVFQAFDSNGDPLAGGKVYTYEPGTSTPKTAYQDSDATTPHTNPIILDADGKAEVWLSGSYKINLTDADDVQQAGYPVDDVSFMPDTALTQSEWLSNAHAFTYASASSFTVPGDETTVYQVGRRVKCEVSAGTVYGVITVSAYTTLTTVTVALDSGALDSGLSDVDVGLLSVTNPALPKMKYTILAGTVAAHAAPLSQIQGGAYSYAVDSGAADAYVAALSPAITALTAGMRAWVKISAANATTTPTLNLNGLGVKTIVRNSGALIVGDLMTNGFHCLEYDGVNFVLLNPEFVGTGQMKPGSVDSTIAAGILGTRDDAKANNTVYQAATDILVSVTLVSANASRAHSTGYTGPTSSPATVRGECYVQYATSDGRYNVAQSYSFVVKKNEYWKVVKTEDVGTATQSIFVVPIGS